MEIGIGKRLIKQNSKKTKACKNCPVKPSCTKAKGQRIIERHQFAEAIERNRIAQELNPEIYKQRQSLVEHPFGTMKRQWGFDHIMTKKTRKRASADVGFIFIAYNLKRILNIMGIKKLIELFRTSMSQFFKYYSYISVKILQKCGNYFFIVFKLQKWTYNQNLVILNLNHK